MGSITRDTPKPMLPVQGKPLLQHILEGLAAAGVEKFFVVTGYKHEMIEDYFKESPLAIEFRLQDPVNGTGTAARLAKNFVDNEPFLLTYGDILCDPSEYVGSGAVLDQNMATAAVVAVKYVDDPWQGAAVYEQNGVISEIIEKPPKGASSTHWNSAGFYVFRPILFEYLDRLQPSPRGEYELTSALDMMLDERLELRISAIQGEWRDVGRPEDLAAVNAGDRNR